MEHIVNCGSTPAGKEIPVIDCGYNPPTTNRQTKQEEAGHTDADGKAQKSEKKKG